MKSNKIFWAGKFLVFGIAFAGLFGAGVMLLWNWLVPALFAGPIINFWQAIGLLVLSKVLFGGFSKGGKHWGHGNCHGHNHGHWKSHFSAKWHQMTPEEREKMKETWRGKCGHWKTEETAEGI